MSGKTELRLFDEQLPQVVVHNAAFIDISPSNAIAQNSQSIEF